MKTLFLLVVSAGIVLGVQWYQLDQKVVAEHAALVSTLETISNLALKEGPFPAKKQLTEAIERMGGSVTDLNVDFSPQHDVALIKGSYNRDLNLWGVIKQNRTFSIEPEDSSAKAKSYVGKLMGTANATVDKANENAARRDADIDEASKAAN